MTRRCRSRPRDPGFPGRHHDARHVAWNRASDRHGHVAIRGKTGLGVLHERDPSGFYAKQAENWASNAAASGAISREERENWVAALHAEQAANRFLAGLTHLFIWGRRPER